MTKKFSLILIAIFLGVGFSTSVFAQTSPATPPPVSLPPKTTWTNISSLWTEYDKAFAYVQELGVPEKKASLISRLNYAKQQIIIHELILRLSPANDPISPARSNGAMMGNIVSDTGCYDTYVNGFYTNKNSDVKTACLDSGERWLTSYRDLVSGITSLFPSSGTPSQPLKAANLRGQLLTLGQNIQGSYDFSCPAPKKSDDTLETHFTFNTDLNSGDLKSLTDKFATAISIDYDDFTVTFSPNIIDSNHDTDTAITAGESDPQQYCLYRCWDGVASDDDSGYDFDPATKSCVARVKYTACGGSMDTISSETFSIYNSPDDLIDHNDVKYKSVWNGTGDGVGSWNSDSNKSYSVASSDIKGSCMIKCKTGFHKEGNTCVSNTRSTVSCGGITLNSYEKANAGKSTFTQTWEGDVFGNGSWTPISKTWSYNQLGTDECVYSCKSFGSGATSNHYTPSTGRCASNTISYSCGGTAPSGNYTYGSSSYTSTWGGASYSPVNNQAWIFSTSGASCTYQCLPSYTKCSSNNSCSSNTKLEPCSTIKGAGWAGSETYTYSSSSCSYQYTSDNCTCATGYGLVNGNCVVNVFYNPEKTYVVYADNDSALKYCQEQNSGFTSSSYTTTNVSASFVFMKRYSRIVAGFWINNLTSSDFPAISTLTCN